MTIRETVYSDLVARRENPTTLDGVIAHFVKPSSPVSTAGLKFDDWVKEIDGQPITSFDQAQEILDEVESSGRPEIVMLVSRGGETSVLRVQLK
ncbi:MAG: hypothetical protein J6386_15370 [Candidatus Synoicihabitans palmerolidicus]|nr:hypothetical protein [Candidatus Synoicihabitans palmerolidicus]